MHMATAKKNILDYFQSGMSFPKLQFHCVKKKKKAQPH